MARNDDPYRLSGTSADVPESIDAVIYGKVLSRKQQLMMVDPHDLRSLPEYTSETFDACGQQQELAVWHEMTSSNEDLFVVQCKHTYILGIGYMCTHGFVLDAANRIRDAEDELMWDYT